MINPEDLAAFEAEELILNSQGIEDAEMSDEVDSLSQEDPELDIDPEDKSIVKGIGVKKHLDDKLSHYSLSQLDLLNSPEINDALCPIVCYYCNKFISPYYLQSLIDVPFIEEDLKPFFETYDLRRYCCRMIILQSRLMLNKQRLSK